MKKFLAVLMILMMVSLSAAFAEELQLGPA